MAKLTPKTTVQPEADNEPVTTLTPELSAANIEDLLADSLLESIDWQKVKHLMLQKAQSKFWAWISAAAPATDYSLSMEVDAIAISGSEVSDA